MKTVQYLLLILLIVATRNATAQNTSAKMLPPPVGGSVYSPAFASLVEAAPGNFSELSKKKYNGRQNFYPSKLVMPGFTSNTIIYDRTPNTYSPSGSMVFGSFDSAKAAFLSVRSSFDSCIGPPGNTYFGTPDKAANWAYITKTKKTGKTIKLLVILMISSADGSDEDANKNTSSNRWLLSYMVTRFDD